MAAPELRAALLAQTSTKSYVEDTTGAFNNTTDPLTVTISNSGSKGLAVNDFVVVWRVGTYATPDLDANARVGKVTARTNKSVTIKFAKFSTTVTALGTGRVRIAKLAIDLEDIAEALYTNKVTTS